MKRLLERLGKPSVELYIGLMFAASVLLMVSVVGVIWAGHGGPGGGDTTTLAAGQARKGTKNTTLDTTADGSTTESTLADGSVVGGPGSASGTGKKKASGGSGTTSDTLPSTPGADRTGLSNTTVKWGVHAPETFGSIPVNFAKDPLQGVANYVAYINDKMGGINGRKIDYQHFNDQYTVQGANSAADMMVDEFKPFFGSGTLGVDQVAIVAARAKARHMPYIAGGGSEIAFKDMGLFQVGVSYDTHLSKLADFLGKEIHRTGSPYFGLTKVGVTRLDSDYIKPSVESTFRSALTRNGLSLVKVVTVIKPTDQTDYSKQISDLKGASVQILVPAQDPLTTSREVQECVSQQCTWKWTISDFAHDSNTALKLMRGSWNGYYGLSGSCYYTNAAAGDPAKCGSLKQAHEEWVAVSDEQSWQEQGQGGIAGYQLVHFWLKALKDAGADVTREKFVAALKTYNGYSDLVSGPITFAGKSTYEHGAEKMVVWQAGVDAWSQAGPGFVDSF
ncbi:MAG: branched-chain amino acid transport system substrate-binding protein [Actinomycetota bacterium]|nr:branched-chain amino acid transport system substrate-binding protein [Actinomycetota bacterium]